MTEANRSRAGGVRWKDLGWLVVLTILFGLSVYVLFTVQKFPHANHAPFGQGRLGPTEVFAYEIVALFMVCLFGAGLYVALRRFLRPPA